MKNLCGFFSKWADGEGQDNDLWIGSCRHFFLEFKGNLYIWNTVQYYLLTTLSDFRAFLKAEGTSLLVEFISNHFGFDGRCEDGDM